LQQECTRDILNKLSIMRLVVWVEGCLLVPCGLLVMVLLLLLARVGLVVEGVEGCGSVLVLEVDVIMNRGALLLCLLVLLGREDRGYLCSVSHCRLEKGKEWREDLRQEVLVVLSGIARFCV
jgi:hypothetical protein